MALPRSTSNAGIEGVLNSFQDSNRLYDLVSHRVHFIIERKHFDYYDEKK
jgi:hypothetical protein